MKKLICKMIQCDKVDPVQVAQLDGANAELLVAAKNVVRVAAYKTLAIKALEAAIHRVETARAAVTGER